MCGIAAVIQREDAASTPVRNILRRNLYYLQHRGEEAAGISVGDGTEIGTVKGSGLVSIALSDENEAFLSLEGHLAIGHVRYSTVKKGDREEELKNAQPFHVAGRHEISLAHNGTITNAQELRLELLSQKISLNSASDSELIAVMIAHSRQGNVVDAVIETCSKLHGAYSLVVMSEDKIIAVRDPFGFRPLTLAKSSTGGRYYLVASETYAFKNMQAKIIRDVARGEVMVIDRVGFRSEWLPNIPTCGAECIFGHVYFQHPNSLKLYPRPNGHLEMCSNFMIRKRMGEILAREKPRDSGIVFGVPDSGIPFAIGFAEQARLLRGYGFTRDRYGIGRSFIHPNNETREQGASEKITSIDEEFQGVDAILTEDSIVRGNMLPQAIRMARESRARTIHIRVGSPPYRYPCWYGIDTPEQSKLLAANCAAEDVESYVRDQLRVESVGYLSIEGMLEAAGLEASECCLACFTGEYKEHIPTLV